MFHRMRLARRVLHSAAMPRIPLLSFIASLFMVAQANAQTITACVAKADGTTRILIAGLPSKYATCAKTEQSVTWNVTGPAGPTGPQGAQGPAGPTGATGATGA